MISKNRKKENAMILVTGDFGFIGSRLMKRLERDGRRAVGFDIRRSPLEDIRDRFRLEMAFELSQCDTVIHLAAHAGVGRGNLYPDEYISTNVGGTWNVVKMCEKYKVDRLISFSSGSVFGNAKVLPVSEDAPKKPISLYGVSKLAGEHIVNSATVKTTVIRPFNVYGENGRKDQVVFKWLEQLREGKKLTLYGDSKSTRGYVYVGDLVDGVVQLLDCGWTWDHEDFNFGGPAPIQLYDIVDAFSSACRKAVFTIVPRPSEDIVFSYANIDKAKKSFGFNPKTVFKEKLTEILKNELGGV